MTPFTAINCKQHTKHGTRLSRISSISLSTTLSLSCNPITIIEYLIHGIRTSNINNLSGMSYGLSIFKMLHTIDLKCYNSHPITNLIRSLWSLCCTTTTELKESRVAKAHKTINNNSCRVNQEVNETIYLFQRFILSI